MKILDVLGISPGIAIGPVFRYESEDIIIEPRSCVDPVFEMERLEDALRQANDELEDIFQKTLKNASEQDAEIFEAHIMFLQDPELLDKVQNYVTGDRYTVEYAWYKAILEDGRTLTGHFTLKR